MYASKRQLDEIVKLVTILQDPSIPEVQKMSAEHRLQLIKDDVTAHQYNIPKDRISDVQALERVALDPRMSKFHQDKAKEAIKKIVNESTAVRSMRRSLIKEMKKRNVENVKDITDFVGKHSKYQNE